MCSLVPSKNIQPRCSCRPVRSCVAGWAVAFSYTSTSYTPHILDGSICSHGEIVFLSTGIRQALLRNARIHKAMNLGSTKSSWTSQAILPTYQWQDAPDKLEFDDNQAAHISLVRRLVRKAGAKTEPELYVCKWYKTSGVKLDSIGGPKYIEREYATLSSLVHENICAMWTSAPIPRERNWPDSVWNTAEVVI